MVDSKQLDILANLGQRCIKYVDGKPLLYLATRTVVKVRRSNNLIHYAKVSHTYSMKVNNVKTDFIKLNSVDTVRF